MVQVAMKKRMKSVDTNSAEEKTSLFPYLSARPFDSEIPTIIKIIPPALNRPNPAEIGSEPKKLMPTEVRAPVIGLIKLVNAAASTKLLK